MKEETEDLKFVVNELIKLEDVKTLKIIREGYTRNLPIELIHSDDRVICEIIDNFLSNHKK